MHGLIRRVTIPLGICLPHPRAQKKAVPHPSGLMGKVDCSVVSDEDFTTHPTQVTEYSDLAHNLFRNFFQVIW